MNAILKMSAFIFPLITFPYVSRVLGVEGNGKIAFATSVISYFTMVAQLGIPTYGIRACAKCRDNPKKLTKTVYELFFISLITTVLSYICLIVMVQFIPKLQEEKTLLYITSCTILLSNLGIEWFYQAIEEYGYITYRNLAFKVLSVILMFMFVHKESDYIIYGAISVVGNVGSNILNLIRLPKYIELKKPEEITLAMHIKPILVFFLFSIATKIYTSLDTVMLGFMSSDLEVGYYSAATKIKNILSSLVTALGTVLLPRASYYIENGQMDSFKNIIKKSIQVVLLIALPLSIYFMVEAKASLLFLAGESYLGAVPATILITPTILLIGLSNISGIQVLIPLGLEKYTFYSTCVGAVIDLVLNYFLIPVLGSAGASIGTLVAEFFVLVAQIIFLAKLHKLDYMEVDKKNSLKIIAANIFALAGILFIPFSALFASYFWQLFFSAAVYFGIYGILLIVFREKIIYENVILQIIQKVKGAK
jgi:O-antigen/teichoic acid export membrane protein